MGVKVIVLDGETKTFGVSGDFQSIDLPQIKTHRVKVVSGQVSVSSKDEAADPFLVIESSVVPAKQNIYTMPGVYQFSFTATGDSELIVSGTTN
jgi:hypothetical protein